MEIMPKENNKNLHVYYSDIMNMFKRASDNFPPNQPKQTINNIFYNSGFERMKFNPQNASAQNFMDIQKFYPSNNNNIMIENGDAVSTGGPRSMKEELKDFTWKRRDSKLLRSPSPIHHDAWKRVTGMNSRPSTPSASMKHKDFSADNISDYSQFNIHEKLPHMYIENNPIMSREDSIISDFDHVKSKGDLDSVM